VKCESGQRTPFFCYLTVTRSDASEVRSHSRDTAFSVAVQLPRACSKGRHLSLPTSEAVGFAQAAVRPFEAKQALSDFWQSCLPSCLASVQGAGFCSRAPCGDVPDGSERWKMLVPASCGKGLWCSVTPRFGGDCLGRVVPLCHLTALTLSICHSVSLQLLPSWKHCTKMLLENSWSKIIRPILGLCSCQGLSALPEASA